MPSYAARFARRPPRRVEVRDYVQRQFSAWGQVQARSDLVRLLVMVVAAGLIASLLSGVSVYALFVDRIEALEAVQAETPTPAP